MAFVIHTLSSSSDDEFPDLSQRASNLLHNKKTIPSNNAPVNIIPEANHAPGIGSDSDIEEVTFQINILENVSTPIIPKKIPKAHSKISKNNNEKLVKKLEREMKKIEREMMKKEKDLAKAEKDREKALQQASKPGECLKYVKVIIDRRLVENTDGSQIVGHVSNAGLKYRIGDNQILNEITFEKLSLDMETLETEREVIIVVPLFHFIVLVYNELYKKYSEDTLCRQCQKWKNNSDKKLTLVVLGIEKYFKNNKTINNRHFRKNVAGATSPPRKTKKMAHESDAQVSKEDVENALIAAQIEEKVNCRLLEGPTKLADFVAQIGKAIAERPFKQTRDLSDFNYYADGASGNAVKVDKAGIGLRRLWLQQLRQFTNVGVETAQAITGEYGSPCALVEAFDNSSNRDALLAEVPVRRGGGPLATTRKIGPELSSKISDFFNATNPLQILGQK